MNPVEITTERLNHAIDPHLHIWEWQIPVYLFLGGLVAGMMIIGAVQELRRKDSWQNTISLWIPTVAMGLLSIGMFALLLDLSYKFHLYRFYMAFKVTSPMSWGSWILMLTYPAMFFWLLGGVSKEQFSSLTLRFRLLKLFQPLYDWSIVSRKKILRWNVVIGIGLGTYTGILLHTLMARPLWNTGLLGPLFLSSGISSAAAFLMLWKVGEDTAKDLLKWDLAAISVEVVLLGLFVLDRYTGTSVTQESINLLLSGPYAGTFFGLVVLGGICFPLLIESLELRDSVRKNITAPLLVLAGGFALRFVLVAAGQVSNYNLF